MGHCDMGHGAAEHALVEHNFDVFSALMELTAPPGCGAGPVCDMGNGDDSESGYHSVSCGDEDGDDVGVSD